MPRKLLALDIETKCGVKDCATKNCWHALIPHLGTITTIGLHDGTNGVVFRDLQDFKAALEALPEVVFVGQNLKFDLKFLHVHGVEIPMDKWAADTQLLAFASLEKVPEPYLEQYRLLRADVNKKLPRGYSHRDAGALSLKVLAPYFLNVEPFWEDPTNHDTDEYVLKDCLYTLQLYKLLEAKTKEQGTFEFYETKLMPWAKMLLQAEIAGITIDLEKLEAMDKAALISMAELKETLDRSWAPAYEAYKDKVHNELLADYVLKEITAKNNLKNPTPERIEKNKAKYLALFEKAKLKADTALNLDSPVQMIWLLKEYFKLDTEVSVRDKKTNIKEIKDSSGSEVLQRLAMKGREDIKTFLDYKEQSKLTSAFFPSYREIQKEGKIHPSFNITGTRTGRLSSSDINAQQIPGDLHKLFIARPGHLIGSYDQGAIEPKLIAYFSEDHVLYDLISNDKDIHGFHTCMFFDLDCDPSEVKAKYPFERMVTKAIGLSLFYGAGAGRVQQEAMKNGLKWSDAQCRDKVKRFKETYETVFKFKASLDRMAEMKPITNLFGRQLSFESDEIYMKAFNTLVQSSASDLVLDSSYKIMNKFKSQSIAGQVLIWVHDELVIEFPESQKEIADQLIRSTMINYELPTAFGPIKLAVEGNVGPCWKK